jgi:hypothetical protein
MIRERALKLVLGLVGLLFLAVFTGSCNQIRQHTRRC